MAKSNKASNSSQKLLHILTKEFQRKSRKGGVIYAIIAKEVKEQPVDRELTFFIEVQSLLPKFSNLVRAELPNEFLSFHNIQHAIDLVPGAQLSNLPAYCMNLREF